MLSVLIRIPAKKGMATRVELRCPDPSANLYLTFAVIAAAGLDGIEKGLQAPASINEDIFHMTEDRRTELGIDNLPGSLEASVQELVNGEIGRKTFGEHVFAEYVAAKKAADH